MSVYVFVCVLAYMKKAIYPPNVKIVTIDWKFFIYNLCSIVILAFKLRNLMRKKNSSRKK